MHIPGDSMEKGKLTRVNRWATNLANAYYLEKDAYFEQNQFVDLLWEKDVLIYIHGFYNDFEDAGVQAAQFAKDIDFRGTVVAFTWPSLGQGSKAAYLADEIAAAASYGAAADFLDLMMLGGPEGKRDMTRRGRRAVLAHSMGNRVLIYGTKELTRRKRIALSQDFGTVVFAAPDVNKGDFERDAFDIVGNAKQAALYVGTEDLALVLSEIIHNPLVNQRAGRHATYIFGMQTIITDPVNSVFLRKGHGYFAGSDRVLMDLSLLINREFPPWKRSPPLHRDKVIWKGLNNLWSVAPAK